MEIKWPKWKAQNWKTPPIWDAVILPRPFTNSNIRYMECFEYVFVLIVSGNANVEIWNCKTGSVVFYLKFDEVMDHIDYCGMYLHDTNGSLDDINNWTIFMVNQNGLIVLGKCNSNEFDFERYYTRCDPVKKCCFSQIGDIKCLILINNEINIINCANLTTLVHVSDAMGSEIHGLLVTTENIIASSDQNLSVFQITMHASSPIELNLWRRLDSHKNKIISLLEIDENYLASISFEAVKIWKKPDFNITRIFNTFDEIGNVNDKTVLCLLCSNRYLTVALNNHFIIFDCIGISTIAKVADAHESKIIGLSYLAWLSMLFTVSEDGVSRLWAFQPPNYLPETIKIRSTSPMSKSMVFQSYFSFSRTKSMEERPFLWKSSEKCDRENIQASCFHESRYLIKSKNHFINLEEIGLLTCDGSSNLLLWRIRDYLVNGLMKLLQF